MSRIFKKRATSSKEYAEQMREHLDEIAFLKTADFDIPYSQSWWFEHKDGRVAHLQDRCPYADIYRRSKNRTDRFLKEYKDKQLKLIQTEKIKNNMADTFRHVVIDKDDKTFDKVKMLELITKLLAKKLEDFLDRKVILRIVKRDDSTFDIAPECASMAAELLTFNKVKGLTLVALPKNGVSEFDKIEGFTKIEKSLSVLDFEEYPFATIGKESKKESHE